MGQYIIRRVLLTIPILLGVTLLTYIIINASGDPLQQFAFNPRTNAATLDHIKHNLGLDQPWYVRYFVWLGNVLHGDLGESMINHRSVATTILHVMPYTLLLSSLAIVIALLISIPMGIFSANHRNGFFDRFLTIFSMAGYAMPIFWLSLLLIILFSSKFASGACRTCPRAARTATAERMPAHSRTAWTTSYCL